MKHLVRHLPDDSALQRDLSGGWTQDRELLASIYDAQQVGNWQRGGRKNAPRPKPWPRPGRSGKKVGTAVPVSRMREILDTWGSEN